MDEILLGRPLLKVLGFDADEHLEANHAVLNNEHFDTEFLANANNLAAGKAALISYCGLLYSTAD